MSARYEMYLEHHGINGMRWGKRNGPPYPLNYNDLSSEERQAKKEQAIRDGNISEANANRKHYSDAELNSVINRYSLNKRLSEIEASQIKTGMDMLNSFSKNAKTISEAIGNGTSLYNNVAKILNATANADLPIIGDKSKNKKNSEKKNSEKKNSKSEKKEETLSEHIERMNKKDAERELRKKERETFKKYYSIR